MARKFSNLTDTTTESKEQETSVTSEIEISIPKKVVREQSKFQKSKPEKLHRNPCKLKGDMKSRTAKFKKPKIIPEDFTLDLKSIFDQKDRRATLMIRNIPNKYTQKMMLDYLEELKIDQLFDFFYLPIDFKNKCNVGYAFINFVHPIFLISFYKQLHGK